MEKVTLPLRVDRTSLLAAIPTFRFTVIFFLVFVDIDVGIDCCLLLLLLLLI